MTLSFLWRGACRLPSWRTEARTSLRLSLEVEGTSKALPREFFSDRENGTWSKVKRLVMLVGVEKALSWMVRGERPGGENAERVGDCPGEGRIVY